MDRCCELVRLLADGKFHSGVELGECLGVGRGAIWKAINKCQRMLDVEIYAISGHGYRLAAPIELLDQELIKSACTAVIRKRVPELTILCSVDSTNDWLQVRAKGGALSGTICLSEQQTNGRGRVGRHWVSPFGSNLYMSLLWRFVRSPTELMGLSLAVGVAAVRAIRSMRCGAIGLKWPNDLVAGESKLGGILVEISGEVGGPCCAIIGIGINLNMPRSAATRIDQKWLNLQEICTGELISRNRVAGRVLNEVMSAMIAFEDKGFSPFRVDWQRFDTLMGSRVRLSVGEQTIVGVVTGINEHGALLVTTDSGVRPFYSGEVSMARCIAPADHEG